MSSEGTMTPQVMRALVKLYKYDSGEYDRKRGVRLYSDAALSEKERKLLADYGWKANEIVGFSGHEDVLEKLSSLKGEPALSKKRCLDAFVAGVGGSYPRGRSALAAWHYLDTLRPHSYEERLPFACCWICSSDDKPKFQNDSYLQYCLYRGNAYSSDPMYAYLNLRHLAGVRPVTPTADDRSVLAGLFDMLRASPGDETPGKFEKRLAGSKTVQGDVYTRRGILDALARVGVIPNRFIPLSHGSWTPTGDIALPGRDLKNMQGRSDMDMPWAGWVGSLGIDEGKASELFGDYL
ncbi:MAG: hypothetical protein FWH47_03935 [Methanomassiliicoccaceae archaeon]|nr:hypothetical protein [Methanomassiliicoccaceae archaeon]